METTAIRLYNGVDFQIDADRLKMTDSDNFGFSGVKKGAVYGISYLSSNVAFQISDFNSDLLNKEYAWMCLCYVIKHAFYLADFAILFRRKFCKLHDFITPLMNLWLWVMWGIFGWIKSDEQIHGGMYLRFRKDVIFSRDLTSPNMYMSAKNEYENVFNIYKEYQGWTWLWIICAIVAASHAVLWLLSLRQKRSSAYTGLSLSVIAVPIQLLVLHLFFKGSWIRSNWATLFIDTTSRPKAMFSIMEDYFEARWIFFILYLTAWAGLVFALACFLRAIFLLRDKVYLKGIKYLCYTIFWFSLFVWTMCMDGTLYHYYIAYQQALIAFHAICLGFALAIFVISVIEKKKEGDKYYYRHDKWALWWWSNNCECDNNAERSAMEGHNGMINVQHNPGNHDAPKDAGKVNPGSSKTAPVHHNPGHEESAKDSHKGKVEIVDHEIHGAGHPYVK